MLVSIPGFKRVKREISRLKWKRFRAEYQEDLSFTAACMWFPARNALYAYMHHHLHHCCPHEIREHRAYFSQARRGFGEDALHAMWFTLLREFRPKLCLEIGVYRGQVVSLWGLIAKQVGFPCEIHGISPFSSAGDRVSRYLEGLDYLEDTLASNARFGLQPPTFVRALSTAAIAREHITRHSWDLIYIDGNHDYDVALADYELCRAALAPHGLLVMDDSSLYTEFRPPVFSFAGHPGPSRVVQQRAMSDLRFVGGVGHNNVFQAVK